MAQFIEVPAARAALTVGGTATGYVTVGDNTPFYPGCEAWLVNQAGTVKQRCLITDLNGATLIGIRFLRDDNQGSKFPSPNYGRSDCSAFTVGPGASHIFMDKQLAPVIPDYVK